MNPHTCKLEEDWLDYFRHTLRIIKDRAFMPHARGGYIYQIDKTNKQCIIRWMHPEYKKSDEAVLDRRCFEALGYKMFDGRATYSVAPPQCLVAEMDAQMSKGRSIIDLRSFGGGTAIIDNSVIHNPEEN